jgi:dolichol-phosphate mannosyltransferase
MKTKQKIVVVIPAFNEEKYIRKVITKVKKFINPIIVVDDCSTDQTSAIVLSMAVHMLRHSINLGKGAAMKTGCEYSFKYLNADAVIFIDGDDQHDPKHLPEFIQKLNAGNNLVFGIRNFSKEMPIIRIMANKFASTLIKLLFGVYISDIPCGYKAITKQAYKLVKWDTADYGVESEIAARTAKLKLPFDTVQINTTYHDYDRGMTALDVFRITTKLVEWRISL